MALEKFLYVNSDGFYAEDAAAIQTSAGASDADKLVKTSSDGKLHPSLINFQLIKRFFVVDVKTDAALPAYTYDNGTSGVGATITADANGALPTIDGISLSVGERILFDQGTSDAHNGIYEVTDLGDGSNPFILTRVTDFDQPAEIEDGVGVAVGRGSTYADSIFLQTEVVTTVGTDDVLFINAGTNLVEAGDGITKSGNTVSADLLASGGLKFVGVTPDGQLAVEPNDFAGDGLVDDGSDNLAIDWATDFTIDAADAKAVRASDLASTANGEGASVIGIEDAGGYFPSDDVESALQQLGLADLGVSFTVGTGGVTAGDLVFVSANNTVETHDDLSLAEWGIGLARTTESAAGTVIVQGNDTVLAGVLSGATAGDKYYWDGSALTTTIPSGSGSHVWRVGVAKNATDLYIDIEFVKKNI